MPRCGRGGGHSGGCWVPPVPANRRQPLPWIGCPCRPPPQPPPQPRQPYHAPLRLPPLQLHSLTAKSTAPLFGSRGGIAGGVPVDGALPTGEGGQGGRARSLVEQPASPREGALTVLAAKAADLMAPLARVGAGAPPPPPPHEIPKEWLEVGAGGWSVDAGCMHASCMDGPCCWVPGLAAARFPVLLFFSLMDSHGAARPAALPCETQHPTCSPPGCARLPAGRHPRHVAQAVPE